MSPGADIAVFGPRTGNVHKALAGKDFETVERAVEFYERLYSDIRIASGAAVVLRSDDSGDEDINIMMPELNSRGLNGSFPSSLLIDDTGGYTRMTGTQIQTIGANGHEIINHSTHHGDPVSTAAAIDNIAEMQSLLISTHDVHCDAFVQPGTWLNNHMGIYTADEAEGWYGNLMRGNFAASGAYVDDPSKLGITHPFPAWRKFGGEYQENDDAATAAAVQAQIDEVIARNGFLHILIHGYLLNEPSQMTTATYQTILNYIQTKRNAGLLDVLTFTGSLYAQRGPYVNLIADPGFELSATGALVGWEVFLGAPTIVAPGGGIPFDGTKVAQVDANNMIRWRCPNNTFRKGELLIRARAVAANTNAVVDVYSRGGATPDYTRTTAVTNAGWTDIRIALGPRGPGASSFRFVLSSDSAANAAYFDGARLIKR